MKKEELLNELYKLNRYEVNPEVVGFMSKTAVKLNHVLALVEQLDEPEKVVVPQFVADFIKSYKDVGRTLYGAIDHMPSGVEHWLRENLIEGAFSWQDTFATIWLNYPNIEVEKEKQYCVIIPTNDLNWKYYYLDNDGGFDMTNDKLDVRSHTEAFIRSVSDELWQFAQPVEEETK